jgi:hypothetical protein
MQNSYANVFEKSVSNSLELLFSNQSDQRIKKKIIKASFESKRYFKDQKINFLGTTI